MRVPAHHPDTHPRNHPLRHLHVVLCRAVSKLSELGILNNT